MYVGQDLVDLQSALNALTADGFFDYSLDVGQVNPYLRVKISNAQLAQWAFMQEIATFRDYIIFYQTTDFSMPVAEFIAAMQAAVAAYATSTLPIWQAYYDSAVQFNTFLAELATKQ